MFLGHRMRKLLACLVVLSSLLSLRAADERFDLKEGDRVLFIGDTFFEREVDYGHIEARLTTTFADRDVTFRNLSWAGDTPMGKARASFDWNKPEQEWLKRVKEQIGLVKPTVAFLSYGGTAALEISEMKSDAEKQAHTDKFIADLGKLAAGLDEVSGQKVRLVVLGPVSQQGAKKDSPHIAAVTAVSAALKKFAADQSAAYVDVSEATRRIAMLRMVTYESPVILNETGYRQLALRIVEMLGGKAPAETDGSETLRDAIRHKNELFFHRWRPANWTYLFGFRKHEQGQNGVEIPKFDPLIAEWDAKIAKLRNTRKQDTAVVAEVRALKDTGNQHSGGGTRPPANVQPVPTFAVADGFEATLWAENPSLHKPIQMNWDPKGRLWIASSEIYPQIKPGQPAVDSIIVLEDTDGDGKADKHTVFADGLLIPTGVVPDGKGGCYVGASHQLLHFADNDGDGKADQRTVVLSSFGTEDTHHNIHTLRWGFDGHLYINQSIYTHTHIETPHGVRRLNSGGIWRFNPDNWRLDVFTKGGCNPWGHHWDQYGNSFFTDGAGFKGVYHAMEGATYFTYSDMRREAESISPGNYPKFASIELVHSPAFPADWQGDVITCDFRAHRVVRFKLTETGSTWQTKEQPDLLRSTNVTFRPIDVRFGPDGALYVADWSNPIIQHGEVDFRDPRRDKEHGRVWRVTAKGAARGKPADLTKLSTADLLDRTLSANGWEQEQARVVLRQRPMRDVITAMRPWLKRQTDPRAKLEAVWLHEAFEQRADDMVNQLATSNDERLRTAAARELSRY
jgi:glucose/arabinose dehydrogenase